MERKTIDSVICESVIQANPIIQHSSDSKSDPFPLALPTVVPLSISTSIESASVQSAMDDKSSSPKILKLKSVCIDDQNALVSDNKQVSFDESSHTEIILTAEVSSAVDTSSIVLTNIQPSAYHSHSDEIISPIDDSSEDHAEIEQTSTEASIENNRLEHDILDTRTEDEAPDIDDDVLPLSAIHSHIISERLLSVEATEDTDITTPIEMRDSHTEKDVNTSLLSGEYKDPFASKGDNSRNDTNEREISELQEDVPFSLDESSSKVIAQVNASHAEVHHGDDIFIDQDKVSELPSLKSINVSDLSNSSKISDNPSARSVFSTEYINVWPSEENRKARRTESTVVETGSTDEASPSDSKSREPSFSDLLDSDEMNRDSLEDEFDKLVVEADASPSSFPSLPTDHNAENATAPYSNPSTLTQIPSSSHQPTLSETGTILACQ